MVVLGKDHSLARRRRPLTATELAASPLVLREQGSGTRDVLAAALADHGLEGFCSWDLGEEDPSIWSALPAHK